MAQALWIIVIMNIMFAILGYYKAKQSDCALPVTSFSDRHSLNVVRVPSSSSSNKKTVKRIWSNSCDIVHWLKLWTESKKNLHGGLNAGSAGASTPGRKSLCCHDVLSWVCPRDCESQLIVSLCDSVIPHLHIRCDNMCQYVNSGHCGTIWIQVTVAQSDITGAIAS